MNDLGAESHSQATSKFLIHSNCDNVVVAFYTYKFWVNCYVAIIQTSRPRDLDETKKTQVYVKEL